MIRQLLPVSADGSFSIVGIMDHGVVHNLCILLLLCELFLQRFDLGVLCLQQLLQCVKFSFVLFIHNGKQSNDCDSGAIHKENESIHTDEYPSEVRDRYLPCDGEVTICQQGLDELCSFEISEGEINQRHVFVCVLFCVAKRKVNCFVWCYCPVPLGKFPGIVRRRSFRESSPHVGGVTNGKDTTHKCSLHTGEINFNKWGKKIKSN